eukprot:CAMPEP_0181183394 /NCGR_PEP_ID=MMETSP1096-20121128/8402_1 /TAXON_ID=156174 ORGANISM="Chrysochromulina ericina, Strain CCMP281" /NCGR_SAMPLE_ID=MMETSP1096 /ASSEMBLY_ACC=CAM_ASM_000453 /LENGTH=355 /DNA_ID=CAMNT_0023272071 /DNA_START=110 /DNA_END=1177 /DNA_ORIENTATION=-
MTGLQYHHLINWLVEHMHSDVEDRVRLARTLGDKKIQLVKHIREHCAAIVAPSSTNCMSKDCWRPSFSQGGHRPVSHASRASHPEYAAGGQMASLLYPSLPPPPQLPTRPPQPLPRPLTSARSDIQTGPHLRWQPCEQSHMPPMPPPPRDIQEHDVRHTARRPDILDRTDRPQQRHERHHRPLRPLPPLPPSHPAEPPLALIECDAAGAGHAVESSMARQLRHATAGSRMGGIDEHDQWLGAGQESLRSGMGGEAGRVEPGRPQTAVCEELVETQGQVIEQLRRQVASLSSLLQRGVTIPLPGRAAADLQVWYDGAPTDGRQAAWQWVISPAHAPPPPMMVPAVVDTGGSEIDPA